MLLLTFIVFRQDMPLVAQSEPCAFDQLMELLIGQDPNYQNQLDAWDQQMANTSSFGGGNDEHIIPIVVHVMHNNGAENISDAQIYQAI